MGGLGDQISSVKKSNSTPLEGKSWNNNGGRSLYTPNQSQPKKGFWDKLADSASETFSDISSSAKKFFSSDTDENKAINQENKKLKQGYQNSKTNAERTRQLRTINSSASKDQDDWMDHAERGNYEATHNAILGSQQRKRALSVVSSKDIIKAIDDRDRDFLIEALGNYKSYDLSEAKKVLVALANSGYSSNNAVIASARCIVSDVKIGKDQNFCRKMYEINSKFSRECNIPKYLNL